MIEEIKIDGILYKLVKNTSRHLATCTDCDLTNFCDKYPDFIPICCYLNTDDYIYKKQ